ncbi:MAG: hypothetical protein QXU21_01615 [Candidatus Bathyarchaeia archaeon]
MKKNTLKENDGSRRTIITSAHENDSARRTIITLKDAQGNDDARHITITKKRGRPRLVLPSEDVLTTWLKEALSNPLPTTAKLRAYEMLWKECNCSFTCLKRFLSKYLPHAVRDEKTLKKYVTLSKAMREAIDIVKNMNTGDLITREELELLIYTYLKQKLRERKERTK